MMFYLFGSHRGFPDYYSDVQSLQAHNSNTCEYLDEYKDVIGYADNSRPFDILFVSVSISNHILASFRHVIDQLFMAMRGSRLLLIFVSGISL